MNNAYDWISSHDKILSKEAQVGKWSLTKAFTSHLWPSSMNYYSPIYSVFLTDLSDLKTLNLRSLWTIRDGMVPLTWFFYRYPEPKGIKTKLLIYEEFMPFVPVAWRKHIGTYRIVNSPATTPSQSLSKRAQLIFTYSASECLDFKITSEYLTSLSQWFKREKINISKNLFLPGPIHGGIGNLELQSSLKTLQLISSLFGPNLDIIHWEKIQLIESCADTFIVDLSNKMLCADSFVHQLLLSRNARFPLFKMGKKMKHKAKVKNYHPISLFHGISYDPSPVNYSVNEGYWERLVQVVKFNKVSLINKAKAKAKASHKSSWPSWLAEWCFLEARNF